MTNSTKRVTVYDALKSLFPDGTVPNGRGETPVPGRRRRSSKSDEDQFDGINHVPVWPPDAFAAAGHVLEKSGIYHYMMPGRLDGWNLPYKVVSDAESRIWREAAHDWSYGVVPQVAKDLWRTLLQDGKRWQLRYTPRTGKDPPQWFKAALGLLVMADEASTAAGYVVDAVLSRGKGLPIVATYLNNFEDYILKQVEPSPGRTIELALTATPTSITLMVNPDLVAVQPKSRTPQVGLAFRTLSHNLALLPPPAEIATHWRRMSGQYSRESETGLNLLLVPFPYVIEAEWFQTIPEPVEKGGIPWGWFDLHQKWLPCPEALADFVCALIRASSAPIHGVIFPEYALAWDHHQTLVKRVARDHREVEFVVSGSSTNCEEEEGNFELTSTIHHDSDGSAAIQHSSRPKHHRWRIDKPQIQEYGLERALDVETMWWEGVQLGRRELNANVFRQGSSFAVMICEDLARADPCHAPLRSLGPNLVICLLMDGVQINGRWSSRAASGLAEDPGSSVLTFTSRALIARSNDVRRGRAAVAGKDPQRPNWSIGHWSDSSGRTEEIHCPPGYHAVLLSLDGKSVNEHSFDGRPNDDGFAWRFSDARCLELTANDPALKRMSEPHPASGKPASGKRGASTKRI